MRQVGREEARVKAGIVRVVVQLLKRLTRLPNTGCDGSPYLR